MGGTSPVLCPNERREGPWKLRQTSEHMHHDGRDRRARRRFIAEVRYSPLADLPASPSVAEVVSPEHSSPDEDRTTGTRTPQLLEPALALRPRRTVDLRFLQDRQIYHAANTEDIPPAFLNSTRRPPVDTSLEDLIHGGHFRRAAETALRALLQTPPTAAAQIFQLLYTRLACLVLIARPDIAAAEAVPLIELTARGGPGAQDVIELIPWDLRLLLLRLQSIGAADGGRRGIMALYALTGEVRAKFRLAQKDDTSSGMDLWRSRLRDLGLRVCDALVEMGELETATRHLDTLKDVDADELVYRKALLRVRVGDVAGARQSARQLQDVQKSKSFEALLNVADGDHDDAVTKWQSLVQEYPDNEQFALNAAVSLVYTGHITAARDLLEGLAMGRPMFPTLLFNLSTIYELCTERAPERKTLLTQQAAAKQPGPASGGWEHNTFDFKL